MTNRRILKMEEEPSEIPDYSFGDCKAWVANDEGVARNGGHDVNKFASLRTWIIKAPYAHPLWSYYVLAVVHLRPIDGMPDPIIRLKGATHEMFLFALDPEKPVALDKKPSLLHPANFIAQFIAAHDMDAVRMIDETASDVVTGRLNPDTDYMQHWIARFGSSNVKGNPVKAGETKIIIGYGTKNETEIIIPPITAPKEKGGTA